MKMKRIASFVLALTLLLTVSASAESGALTQQQKTAGDSTAVLSSVLPIALPGPVAGRCVAEGLNAAQSAPDEIQTEPEAATQTVTQGVIEKKYYSTDDLLLFMEEYLYYDNGLPCVKKLSFCEHVESVYYDIYDVYSMLYLYDADGNLSKTMIDAGYNTYDDATGIVTFSADVGGEYDTFTIAPESESIEQEKFFVDSSKTKEITGDLPMIPFENTDGWADLYLDLLEKDLPADVYGCAFLMLDDDEFPELLVDYGGTVNSVQMYTRNGSALSCAEGISVYNVWEYNPRSGLALTYGGRMGVYPYLLYKLENGVFTTLSEGTKSERWENNAPVYDEETQSYVYDYTWNGVAMDEETFDNAIIEALGGEAVTAKTIMSYEQCDALLHHITGR